MKQFAITTLLCVLLCACSEGHPYLNVRGNTWGTQYSITYRGDPALADSITAVMRDIDLSLSPFEPQSLVSALNRGDSVVADRMLSDVFCLSQHVCSISGGAFDPTVAPLINAWGFGYKQGAPDRPSSATIDSLMEFVGILDCNIDTNGVIVKKNPETEFNFSAVAKGYGVDCVAAMLRRNGVNNYMVEIGGEIALSGLNSRGENWRIQVDTPVDDIKGLRHDAIDVLQLTDACIATSGNYRNYHDTSQGRVAHTISAATGYPVQTHTLSATVITDRCAVADALATAVMAMPTEQAMMLLKEANAQAMLVIASDDGGMEIIYTPDFNFSD